MVNPTDEVSGLEIVPLGNAFRIGLHHSRQRFGQAAERHDFGCHPDGQIGKLNIFSLEMFDKEFLRTFCFMTKLLQPLPMRGFSVKRREELTGVSMSKSSVDLPEAGSNCGAEVEFDDFKRFRNLIPERAVKFVRGLYLFKRRTRNKSMPSLFERETVSAQAVIVGMGKKRFGG